jgi:hypothetical protein
MPERGSLSEEALVEHEPRSIINRPLLHMHLRRLEAAGVVGSQELSAEGKAMKFSELAELDLHLTPALLTLAASAQTLTGPEKGPTTEERF